MKKADVALQFAGASYADERADLGKVEENLRDRKTAARQIEARLARSYRDQRALELAMLQKITPERARTATGIATSDRPLIAGQALSGTPRTPAELKGFQEVILAARQEMDSMLTLAREMAGTVAARTAADEMGATVDVAATAQPAYG